MKFKGDFEVQIVKIFKKKIIITVTFILSLMSTLLEKKAVT